MPTGFTDKILNGEITSFEEFAILCTRAFGATFHMRNSPVDVEYEKRTPNEYYQNSIDKLNKEIENFTNITNEDLRLISMLDFESKKSYYESKITKIKKDKVLLDTILNNGKNFRRRNSIS